MIIQCWADFQNGWNLIFFTAFCYLLCHTSGTHIESQKELNHRITKNLWVTIHQHKIFVSMHYLFHILKTKLKNSRRSNSSLINK